MKSRLPEGGPRNLSRPLGSRPQGIGRDSLAQRDAHRRLVAMRGHPAVQPDAAGGFLERPRASSRLPSPPCAHAFVLWRNRHAERPGSWVMTDRPGASSRSLGVHRCRFGRSRGLELGISETTARQHLSGLYRRTGCLNAAQAAYWLASSEGRRDLPDRRPMRGDRLSSPQEGSRDRSPKHEQHGQDGAATR
jgi:hypothetical protein